MRKIVTLLSLLLVSSTVLAAADLDGKSYCRPVISDGMFGQPKGVRSVCLNFSNGIATDENSTLGGNAPTSAAYHISGRKVIFGDSEYEMSLDRRALMTVSGSSTSGIIYMLKVTDFNDIQVPQSWIGGKVNPASLATREQLEIIQKVLLMEISSKRSDEESLVIINANLKSLGLPEIKANPDIEVVESNGGFAGGAQGAVIKDDSHLYCIPCTLGRNRYEFGIMSLEKAP